MKKNNMALWGTGFVGAFICIMGDFNFTELNNSSIVWMKIAVAAIALICAYLFFNDAFKVLASETGEKNEEELVTAEMQVQEEKERQERLEKKLDELILAEKAVYTILKKEAEVNEAAYEKMEIQFQEMSDKLLNSQQTAVKALIKYNHDDMQGVTKVITEELLKVQNGVNDFQNHMWNATGEIKTEIQNQTKIMDNSLGNLKESIQNMNISVAPPVVEAPAELLEVPAEAAVSSEDVRLKNDFTEDELENTEIQSEEADFPEDILARIKTEEEPESVAPASVMDDPNRAMTPDEIAALIASMN